MRLTTLFVVLLSTTINLLAFTEFLPQSKVNHKVIHDLVREGDVRAIEYIIGKKEKDIDIDLKDNYDYTPLHLAVRAGNLDIAKLLISVSANVNNIDSFGDSPLMDAVKNGDTDMVRLLLCSGADATLENKDSMSAGGLAYLYDKLEVIRVLESEDLLQMCKKAKLIASDAKELGYDGHFVFDNSYMVSRPKEAIKEVEHIVNKKPKVTHQDNWDNNHKIIARHDALYHMIYDKVASKLNSWNATLSKDDKVIKIFFKNTMDLFEFDSSILTTRLKRVLDEFFPNIALVSSKFDISISDIVVDVYTDTQYDFDENNNVFGASVSQKRAIAIVEYITSMNNSHVVAKKDWIDSVCRTSGVASNSKEKNGIEFRLILSEETE
jgi:outer membrane protein OmpA-like peptidoglycan-associated protein